MPTQAAIAGCPRNTRGFASGASRQERQGFYGLPMVDIDKEHVFDGRDGKASLLDLAEGRGQLLIYHFMFDPDWDEGCPTCSFLADNIGHLAHLHARDTTLALVSRAPLAKIEPFRRRMGWAVPWYSSFGTDFNYDFHAGVGG